MTETIIKEFSYTTEPPPPSPFVDAAENTNTATDSNNNEKWKFFHQRIFQSSY